jgi:hypothetical protein
LATSSVKLACKRLVGKGHCFIHRNRKDCNFKLQMGWYDKPNGMLQVKRERKLQAAVLQDESFR